MNILTRIIITGVVAAEMSCALPAASEPISSVVLVRDTGKALLIWQATSFIGELAAAHLSEVEERARIESAALQIIARRKGSLSAATSVSIKVIFARNAVSTDPEYGQSVFGGFQQMLILTVTKSALARSALWPKIVDPKRLPRGVTANVSKGGL